MGYRVLYEGETFKKRFSCEVCKCSFLAWGHDVTHHMGTDYKTGKVETAYSTRCPNCGDIVYAKGDTLNDEEDY